MRQLEALGHDPADVRHIITTHLDLDHAGGIGDFPEAQIHLFASELAEARSPGLLERARYVRSSGARTLTGSNTRAAAMTGTASRASASSQTSTARSP